MKKLLATSSITLILISSIVLPAYADTITHFGDGPFADVTTLLNLLGIPNVPASETTAMEFMVPGMSGTVDLTYTFERDTGSFLFSFGFCNESTVVGIDPIAQKQAWATACLAAATEVFDDTGVNPGATSMHTVSAGTVLIFYVIPDNDLAVFNANPGNFYPSQTSNNALRAPLFSVSNANPGEFDQMLSFIGGGVTLFTFEDLTRSGPSDEDFTDIAFSIDSELMPMMPSAVGGELIPLDATMVLVAGTHSVAAWMIPVIVSGIGIAIVVARKF